MLLWEDAFDTGILALILTVDLPVGLLILGETPIGDLSPIAARTVSVRL